MLTLRRHLQRRRGTESHLSLSSSSPSISHLSLILPCLIHHHRAVSLMFFAGFLSLISLTGGLSVDGNLDSRPGHHLHPDWSIDDWWRQTVNEDVRAEYVRQFAQLRAINRPVAVQSRSFPADDEDDEQHASQLGKSSLPVTFAHAISGESMESAESAPPKRTWSPTKVHFPQSPVELDTMESLEMKTSVGNSRNQLHPRWRASQANQTKTENNSRNRPWGNKNGSASRPSHWSSDSYFPQSSLPSIQNLFYEYFMTVRSTQESTRASFLSLKRNLRQKFLDLNLLTGIQSFNVTRPWQPKPIKGHNLIGIWPGTFRNVTGKDSILVVGAHFDSVPNSMGIEDNASGSVAVIELARLLHEYKCTFNTTLIFVLFDMEEDGLYGSKHFVRDYLYPVEIEQRRIPVKGAIVMDMLLEYDTDRNSQSTDALGNLIPSWRDAVRQNENRADFAAVWARRSSVDTALYKSLKRNWLNANTYKLLLLDPPLPGSGRQLTKELRTKKANPYKTFLRSDHSSFWYPHSLKNYTIPAILVTDLGPWRRRTMNRYHSVRDNTKLLSKGNLLFLKNSIDSLLRTLLEMGNGKCQPPVANSVEAAAAMAA